MSLQRKMVMKPAKQQRSKQRCQDLGWKVHDGETIFCFVLMHYERFTQPKIFYWLVPQYGVKNYCVLCTVKIKKENKNLQQRNLSVFITIPLY